MCVIYVHCQPNVTVLFAELQNGLYGIWSLALKALVALTHALVIVVLTLLATLLILTLVIIFYLWSPDRRNCSLATKLLLLTVLKIFLAF